MKRFQGNWYTSSCGAYGSEYRVRFSPKYIYRYHNSKGKYVLEEKLKVKYKKTSYGYYVTVYGSDCKYGYRAYSSCLKGLDFIGGGNPNSMQDYSGSSSLQKF